MSEMTIREVVDAKRKLQREIANLLDEFDKSTGIYINGISIKTINVIDYSGEYERIAGHAYSVEVEAMV